MIAREIKKLGIDLDKELKELIMQPTHEKLHQIFIYMTDFERGGGCERLQAGLLQNGIPPMVAMG